MTAERRRREPWPIALALLLLAMIGVSLGLYAIAESHPDRVLQPARPGPHAPAREVR
jgi:hypothetical protein